MIMMVRIHFENGVMRKSEEPASGELVRPVVSLRLTMGDFPQWKATLSVEDWREEYLPTSDVDFKVMDVDGVMVDMRGTFSNGRFTGYVDLDMNAKRVNPYEWFFESDSTTRIPVDGIFIAPAELVEAA